MAGENHFHLRTLAQVASLIRVDGSWPGSITLSAGWFRARARPWNDETPNPMVRLERGGADFLSSVTNHLIGMDSTHVYSPALYPDATRVWRRATYGTHARLGVMERSLLSPPTRVTDYEVEIQDPPDWEAVLAIDEEAFTGFWRMSRLGLSEAYDTNRRTALFTTNAGGELIGYAIVGTHWGITYLHRIAVHPDHGGRGFGGALIDAAIAWGRKTGARTIVLNVRDENVRARLAYERAGFAGTGMSLEVLRYPAE